MAETLNTRVGRLERALVQLARAQAKTEKAVTKTENAVTRLANAQAHLVGVQAQHEAEIRKMKREALERERRLDDRIEKLVIAIVEFIRRSGKQGS
jgi:predicted  nucleic acid-binding Zn-ribbon protein